MAITCRCRSCGTTTARYLYLPRLTSRSVLDGAIEDGVSSLSWSTDGFAYADTIADGRYGGLVAGSRPAAIAPSGLLVNSDVAQQRLATETEARESGGVGLGADHRGVVAAGSEGSTDGTTATAPSRYYGRITLDSMRWARTIADIADAVVTQLEKGAGAKVRITLEVEAESDGFNDAVQRTVNENAATLKFETSEFES
ncbi:MAG: hypothetical protein M5T61_19990 [Acidimicrobiia bacterium]|nr:hypothetical protein [Acidimicrobiia bacterium]